MPGKPSLIPNSNLFPHACDIGLVVRMSADTFHDKQTYKTESFYFIEKFTFAKQWNSFVKP